MSKEVNDIEREVLQLHIGSAGIEIGNSCWQLYCLEHHLNFDGHFVNEVNSDDIIPPQSFFFQENQHYRPRALFIDIDSNAMDGIKTSRMKNFYNDNQFLVSSTTSDSILNRIRKQIEGDDYFQGFIFSHSTSGKCSNLISELLINLKSEYSNKIILTNSIVGSSTDIRQMSNLLKYADMIIPMENQAISNLCQNSLNIDTPTYTNIDKLIATCWSNITCSMRFDGYLLSNLNEFQTKLIPFPSLKLITSYLSPLIPYSSSENSDFQSPSVYDMCIPSFTESNQCFINRSIKYKMVLSLVLRFRGENIIPKEIGQKLICEMKRWIKFSDCTPTGFQCGIDYQPPPIFDDQSDIARTDKQVLMLTNETATSTYLCDFILNQHHKTSEKTEDRDAENDLQELKANYKQFENEIVNDHQLDLTTAFS